MGEARRYREAAAHLLAWSAEGESFYNEEGTREQVTHNIRAALAHETWAARQRDEISASEFTVAEKLIDGWHGSELSNFLAAIRAIAS